MNILLSCVGRRNYMVDYFKAAVGPSGKVICTNSHMDATGMIVADKAYEMPPVHDKEYIQKLLEISLKENVKLIVSLFDIDLPYLAAAKDKFADAGILVIVSSPAVIEIANDKWKTYNFLKENGFHTPATYNTIDSVLDAINNKEITYPLFIKPRWGMGSIAIYKADNKEELHFFYDYTLKQIKESYLNILSNQELEKAVLIQEYIQAQEYGLDVFNDLNGNHLVTIVKKKLAMRSGETDAAITVDNAELQSIGEKIAATLKHVGNLDVDILYNQNIPYVLELNARFGGGYPFSHLAGVNFPQVLVDWASESSVNEQHLSALTGVKGLKAIDLITYKS